MIVFKYIFWIAFAIVFYNYIGYGILLWIITTYKELFRRSTSKMVAEAEQLPLITVVVAAYNEEDIIEKKIKNCLELDYPIGRCSFLFITDGSDDNTPLIISKYAQVQLLHQPQRSGKTAALNRAMQYVITPITVFCDANTLLNREALRHIVRHYRDPEVGGVAGEKRVLIPEGNQTAAASEGIYWKYESLLKRLDSKLYTVAGAAGELFSIRTSLWEPVPTDIILDDFMISARINLHGYRVVYDPTAWASEQPSSSIEEEKKRKIRISAGAFQAMSLLKPLFNVFRHPVLAFQFISHRFLRWTLTPLCFPILFLSNVVLMIGNAGNIYILLLCAQVGFYLLALTAALFEGSSQPKIMKISYYLVFMNYALYLGFFRFMRGRQTAVWEKAKRKAQESPSL